MGWSDITGTIGVVFGGLIAGQMLAIGQSNQANTAQPASEWVRRFQLENWLFTRTMPPALLIPLFAMAASAILAVKTARICYGVATVGMVAVLLITMAVNVPINRTVATWSVSAPPANWSLTRDRWLTSHWIRTLIGILSFSFAAVARHSV